MPVADVDEDGGDDGEDDDGRRGGSVDCAFEAPVETSSVDKGVLEDDICEAIKELEDVTSEGSEVDDTDDEDVDVEEGDEEDTALDTL